MNKQYLKKLAGIKNINENEANLTPDLLNLFGAIALKHFGIKTLKTRNSDSLDFHQVAVWNIIKALDEAYSKGYSAGHEDQMKMRLLDMKDKNKF